MILSINTFLVRTSFTEMDTDAAYITIYGNSFEELINPELREEFEKDNHNWFVTPRAPQGK